nr:hypothetical protein [Nitrosomonas nitrosa]
MKSEFQKQMKKRSAQVMAAMKAEYAGRRFYYGTQNSVRLRKALASEALHHLHHRTLLSPQIHTIHAARLTQRFLRQLEKVKLSVRQQRHDFVKTNRRYGRTVNPSSITAHDRFRFITVLQGLEVLDVTRILKQVRAFKEQLRTVIEGCRGLWCLGAIEVEVVSMEMMRQLTDQSDSEERKLLVCTFMEKRLAKRDQGLPSYFLIHFHGVVVANRPCYFHGLEKRLKLLWKQESRQVQVKPLSKVFNGKPKPPEKSLMDIARYITKGGNDWIGKKAYLRYKLGFDNEHLDTEEAWENRNWRRNKTLQREHREEGLEDVLSMSRSEINALAQVIDGMMRLDRKRTGYLVFGKSKRKKKLTTIGLRAFGRVIAA